MTGKELFDMLDAQMVVSLEGASPPEDFLGPKPSNFETDCPPFVQDAFNKIAAKLTVVERS